MLCNDCKSNRENFEIKLSVGTFLTTMKKGVSHDHLAKKLIHLIETDSTAVSSACTFLTSLWQIVLHLLLCNWFCKIPWLSFLKLVGSPFNFTFEDQGS